MLKIPFYLLSEYHIYHQCSTCEAHRKKQPSNPFRPSDNRHHIGFYYGCHHDRGHRDVTENEAWKRSKF